MKIPGKVWTWMKMRELSETTHTELGDAQYTSHSAHKQPPTPVRRVTRSPCLPEGSQRKVLELLTLGSSGEESQLIPQQHRHQGTRLSPHKEPRSVFSASLSC